MIVAPVDALADALADIADLLARVEAGRAKQAETIHTLRAIIAALDEAPCSAS